jgi:uncharacterized protein (TIGR03435 family)
MKRWFAGSPVLDHTGGHGTYNFKMKWAGPDDVDSLASGLRKQLGLTLKSFPLERLVIEDARRPATTL